MLGGVRNALTDIVGAGFCTFESFKHHTQRRSWNWGKAWRVLRAALAPQVSPASPLPPTPCTVSEPAVQADYRNFFFVVGYFCLVLTIWTIAMMSKRHKQRRALSKFEKMMEDRLDEENQRAECERYVKRIGEREETEREREREQREQEVEQREREAEQRAQEAEQRERDANTEKGRFQDDLALANEKVQALEKENRLLAQGHGELAEEIQSLKACRQKTAQSTQSLLRQQQKSKQIAIYRMARSRDKKIRQKCKAVSALKAARTSHAAALKAAQSSDVTELNSKQAELESKNTELTTLGAELQPLRNELQATQNELEDKNREAQAQAGELQTAKDEVQRIQLTLTSKTSELETSQDALQAEKAARQAEAQQRGTVTEEKGRLQADLEALRALLAEMERVSSGKTDDEQKEADGQPGHQDAAAGSSDDASKSNVKKPDQDNGPESSGQPSPGQTGAPGGSDGSYAEAAKQPATPQPSQPPKQATRIPLSVYDPDRMPCQFCIGTNRKNAAWNHPEKQCKFSPRGQKSAEQTGKDGATPSAEHADNDPLSKPPCQRCLNFNEKNGTKYNTTHPERQCTYSRNSTVFQQRNRAGPSSRPRGGPPPFPTPLSGPRQPGAGFGDRPNPGRR